MSELNMRVLDLETMGTAADAKICVIGWTDIINGEIVKTKQLCVHWQDTEYQASRSIDSKAFSFWEEQVAENPEAAEFIFGIQKRVTLHEAITEFMDDYRNTFTKEVPVASKGPEFDAAILRSAAEQLNIPLYHYRQNNSVRTYELLGKQLGLHMKTLAPPEAITHHAGYDSLREAKAVLGVTNHIFNLNDCAIDAESIPY